VDMVPRVVVPTELNLHTDGALDVYRWRTAAAGTGGVRARSPIKQSWRPRHWPMRAAFDHGPCLTRGGLAPHRTLVSREQHTVTTLIGRGCDADLIPIEQAAAMLAAGHRSCPAPTNPEIEEALALWTAWMNRERRRTGDARPLATLGRASLKIGCAPVSSRPASRFQYHARVPHYHARVPHLMQWSGRQRRSDS
jgi:hypothetical protein